MTEWKFLDYGKRPCEVILARYTPGGVIKQVASAFPYKNGYIYKLYPTDYKGIDSINQTITVSVRDIDLRRDA